MPTTTTTVTTAGSSGTTTVTTTESISDDAGYVFDGLFNSWVVNVPADQIGPHVQFDSLLEADGLQVAFDKSECTGSNVGDTRSVWLTGMPDPLVEQCTATSATGHSYTLISKNAEEIFKLKNYRSTFAAFPASETSCVVSWTCTYQTSDPETSKGALLGFVPLMDATFTSLEQLLSGSPKIARPIMDEATELTPEWLTTALNERNHLPAGVSVTSLEFLNLGEGRGYAGKTLKIYNVVYTGSTTLPDTFVLKVPNYMMESIDWGEAIFTMCDLGFRQENHFYEKCSAKHPLELPSMYWIGEEPNPEPAKKMPRASILMSIVEDPAMISQVDGCSESDAKDFLSALARVQATWWNSDELDKADWIMSSETVGDFKMKVMQEALPRMANIPEFLELDGSAEFLELCKKAAPQIATLNELAGKNGKSLCHGDARTENCLWPNQRKDPLVLIDWQFVSYAHVCSDLCYFIAVCLTPEEQDKYGDSLIRFYYDTLTSSPGGPSTSEYTWEAFQLDYKREMWVSCWVSCMGVSNIQCISDEAEKHKGTPTEEAFLTLKSNMIPLLMAFITRHMHAVKRSDAGSVL